MNTYKRFALASSATALLAASPALLANDVITECVVFDCDLESLKATIFEGFDNYPALVYNLTRYQWVWTESQTAPVGGLSPVGFSLNPPQCGHLFYQGVAEYGPFNATEQGRCTTINTSFSLSKNYSTSLYGNCSNPGAFTPSTDYECGHGWWAIDPRNQFRFQDGGNALLGLFFGVSAAGTYRVEDNGIMGFVIHLDWVGTGDFTGHSGTVKLWEVALASTSSFQPGACYEDPENPGTFWCSNPDGSDPGGGDDDNGGPGGSPIPPGPYVKPDPPDRPEIPADLPPPPEIDQPLPSDYENQYPDCEECRILMAILQHFRNFGEFMRQYYALDQERNEWLKFLWDEQAVTNEILVDLMNLLIHTFDPEDPDSPEPREFEEFERPDYDDQGEQFLAMFQPGELIRPDQAEGYSLPERPSSEQIKTQWDFVIDLTPISSYFNLGEAFIITTTVDLSTYQPFRAGVHAFILMFVGFWAAGLVWEELRRY